MEQTCLRKWSKEVYSWKTSELRRLTTTTSHHIASHLPTSHHITSHGPTNQVGIPPNPNLSQINRHNIYWKCSKDPTNMCHYRLYMLQRIIIRMQMWSESWCAISAMSCPSAMAREWKCQVLPPLQIAEYINSIKTKQENFELKLEQSQSLGSPRSWLKIGCSKQRPTALRQSSPRKLQAVISSHPTRYFAGSSCTWHILLETPKGVTKEPTHLASQRKWKQSNPSETCSLPHHMAWPLRRWASKLYACAAALVARRQPVQVCREASRNALHIHRLTGGFIMIYLCLCWKLACRMPGHSTTNATIWGSDHNGSSDCGSKICPGCAVTDALGRDCYVALSIGPTACQVMSGLFLRQDNIIMDHGDQLATIHSLITLIIDLHISIHHIHICLVHCSFETKVSCLAHRNFYTPEFSQYVQMSATFPHKSEARERPQALPLESNARKRARK